MQRSEMNREIGARIRQVRHWRGLTQRELGDRLRVRVATVCDQEAGRHTLGVWTLVRLAAALSVPSHIWLLAPDEWRAWCRAYGIKLEPNGRRV